MLRAAAETALNTRYIPDIADVPQRPDPRPKFLTTQMASSIEVNTAMFKVAERKHDFAARVQRYLIPPPVER
jgi:hypothetical protein